MLIWTFHHTLASKLSRLGLNTVPAINCHSGVSQAGWLINVCVVPRMDIKLNWMSHCTIASRLSSSRQHQPFVKDLGQTSLYRLKERVGLMVAININTLVNSPPLFLFYSVKTFKPICDQQTNRLMNRVHVMNAKWKVARLQWYFRINLHYFCSSTYQYPCETSFHNPPITNWSSLLLHKMAFWNLFALFNLGRIQNELDPQYESAK